MRYFDDELAELALLMLLIAATVLSGGRGAPADSTEAATSAGFDCCSARGPEEHGPDG